jgi:dihydrofolate reductase
MMKKAKPKENPQVQAKDVTFVYYFANSADGFVADAQGGVDWLNAYDDADYGFNAFMKSIEGVVMGRKTYEQALGFGPWYYHGIPCVVLSKTRTEGPHVEFWNQPVEGLREYFAAKGVRRIWMLGGGEAAAAFVNAGMIDDIEQYVMPIVLGTGIPAYGPLNKNVALKLTATKSYKNGVVMVRYQRADGKAANAERPAAKASSKAKKARAKK